MGAMAALLKQSEGPSLTDHLSGQNCSSKGRSCPFHSTAQANLLQQNTLTHKCESGSVFTATD
eukprot:1161361-Pelagomonas_calceolata.AAC.13